VASEFDFQVQELCVKHQVYPCSTVRSITVCLVHMSTVSPWSSGWRLSFSKIVMITNISGTFTGVSVVGVVSSLRLGGRLYISYCIDQHLVASFRRTSWGLILLNDCPIVVLLTTPCNQLVVGVVLSLCSSVLGGDVAVVFLRTRGFWSWSGP